MGGYYIWTTQIKTDFSKEIMINEQVNMSTPKEIHSQTVLLKNLQTGDTLIEKNKDKEVEIASLTKLITAYLLLEFESDLTKTVQIDQRVIDNLIIEGASLSGFVGGDEVSIQDLAYGVVLPSGGDAAIVAANYVSGSEEAFVKEMNRLGKEVGMTQTHFKNATGLDERNQYATVADLSKFLDVALKNEEFKQLVTTTTYQTSATSYMPEGYYLESTMLKESKDLSLVNGRILGGKTGYTKKAGQCLVSLAEVNNEMYVLITTGADGTPFSEQYNMTDAKYIYENII